MTDIFLQSGKAREHSLVLDDKDLIDINKIKIANVVAGTSMKNSSNVGGLFINNKKGAREFDTEDAELFAVLFPTPDPNLKERNQRDVVYVSAPSGSGKSTWASRYAEAFQKTKSLANGKMPRVIMFSAVNEDKEFDSRILMKRIQFKDLVDEDGKPTDSILIEDLKDSLVIFDDIDVVHNKELRKWLTNLRNQCLEIGRHFNISLVCTTHQLMNYAATKILLMEATKVVIFPRSGAIEQIKRFFRTYGGLSKEQMTRTFKLQTQWIMLSKTYPRYILHANGAYFLD